MELRQASGDYMSEWKLKNEVQVDYTNAEQEILVNTHNKYRRQLVMEEIEGLDKISNMNRLVCSVLFKQYFHLRSNCNPPEKPCEFCEISAKVEYKIQYKIMHASKVWLFWGNAGLAKN